MFIETIKVQNGIIESVEYHNERLNRTLKEIFNLDKGIDLQEYITPPNDLELYRCRVVYAQEIESVEFFPYTPKEQRTFKIIESSIEYGYKYANRELLNALKAQHLDVDDIIISKHGLLQDTTIANIAFFDGVVWWTPNVPLLRGTMRTQLLQKGNLQTKDIKSDEIDHYHGFAIMNAMVGFKVINNPMIIRSKDGESTISKPRV